MTVSEKAFMFKTAVDVELVHLPLEDFIEAVALTVSERKQADNIIKEAEAINWKGEL